MRTSQGKSMHTVVREAYFSMSHFARKKDDFIRMCPLVAAIIAPLSVMFDIPALSQPWYGLENQRLTDETTSLILSTISLFTNLVANILLMLRFSVESRRGYTIATRISIIFWIIKVVVALVNLVLFGAGDRNTPGYQYLEGFWCAVVSLALAFLSAAMLLAHYFYEFDPAVALKNNEIRLRGRGFMVNVTLFVASIAIQGLILSRIEHWTYLDGLYFATVSILTVGFGDLSPETTAGKIVLFPLVLIGIAQLAVVISNIIDFFSENSMMLARATKQHVERERLRQELSNDSVDINEELRLLSKAQRTEDNRDEMINLGYSMVSFMLLWFLGALIFSKLEGWTFGDGLYFNYVFFLTLGYGDYEPETAASRPVFIVYALLAVPVITSFAVQSVTKAMTLLSKRRWIHRRNKLVETDKPLSHHELLDQARADLVAHTHVKSLDKMLIDIVIELDLTTRKLLAESLTGGSKLLMKADTLVQLRNTNYDFDEYVEQFHDINLNDELAAYRRLFARFLTTASAVQKLEGEEQRVFERRIREHEAEVERAADLGLERNDSSASSSSASAAAGEELKAAGRDRGDARNWKDDASTEDDRHDVSPAQSIHANIQD